MKNVYQTVKIVRVEEETVRVKNFVLDTAIKAKPGQYVMVWLPRLNEKPFGIVESRPMMLSVAGVGPFTKAFHQLKKGDQLTFRGPYGKPFLIKKGNLLLVAGGYGVAPLYFLARSLPPARRKKITVVIGAKTKLELPFVTKFKKLGCRVLLSTNDGSVGFKGFTTQLADELLKKEKFDGVYSCGPLMMMKKIAELCYLSKMFCQVSMESFFKCGGIGLCGECSFKGHLVCKEGPVFNGSILVD